MKISIFLFEFFLFSLLVKSAISVGAIDGIKPRVIAFLNPGAEKREFTAAQASKLTHLILHVVFLDSDGMLQFVGEDEDYERTMRVARGNPTLKVMVNIAGDEGFSDFLSLTLNSTERRMSMVRNIANFMETTGLDGINIYWHHPVINGIKEDRQNYVHFLRELHAEFTKLPRQMCISILTTKHVEILAEHFDLEGIAEHVDFIGSMSYGYNSPAVGARFTGPLAPIFKSRPNESDFLHSTMKTLACGAKNSKKINMGIGFYGFYWGRVSPQKRWDMDEMWRLPLDTTFENRFMRWRDIAAQYNLSAAEFHARARTMYYYDSAGQFFIGTENVRSLEEKLNYITEFGIGGISISALDGDDDNDTLLITIDKWRSSAKSTQYENQFRCKEQSTDSTTNPLIFPRETEWFQRQETCCEEFNMKNHSSLDGPPIDCTKLTTIDYWPTQMLKRIYFGFFSNCVLYHSDLRSCCQENGISDDCLPICNANDVLAFNSTENKQLFGLNCSVRAQEQAAQCMLDGMQESNRKKRFAIASFSILAPSIALLILIVFFVARKFRPIDDKIAKSLKDMMKLGEGAFGEVFAAKLHGKRVAVKKLKFGASSKELLHEFSILQKLEHQYICKTLHIITLDDRMAMVTELADLGNLQAYLLDNNGKDKHKMLGNQQLTAISLMIASGLEYLFSKNVIHRDLAARNCLVFSREHTNTKDNGLPIVVKISDFGLARILGLLTSVYTAAPCTLDCKVSAANGAPLNNNNDNHLAADATSVASECIPLVPFSINGLVLPLRNAAPESVDRRKYSKESDIWSFGILLVEIFSYGQPPYANLSEQELVESISNGIPPQMPDNMPAKVQTLVNACCQLEPTKRVGIAQIVATLDQQVAVATKK